MKEMTLKEIQKAELELLVKFDALCGENDIKYSLHGGTLLGAVRHKGFIPWDDDVDVMMLRPEYEKFIELCKRIKTDFRLVNNETDPGFSFAFSKISNENTVLKGIHRLGMKHGLYIDIIPIDYIGKDTEYIKSLKKELDHVHALSMRKRNSFFHENVYACAFTLHFLP